MKNRLLILIPLMLTAVIVGMAQTSDELTQRYGPRDQNGRYMARPGIGVTVEFGVNGQVSQMMIKPLDIKSGSAEAAVKVMPSETVSGILQEVAPVDKRGQYRGTTVFRSGCTSVEHIDYERVAITLRSRCERQGGGTYSAGITWKR
jgi:hypothetical protein